MKPAQGLACGKVSFNHFVHNIFLNQDLQQVLTA